MKYVYFFACLFVSQSLLAQHKECVFIDWSRHYGGSLTDIANEIAQTTDGGFIVAGYSKSANIDVTQNAGDADCWVVKLDPNGDIEWQKSFGGSKDDVASSILQTSDGGYIVAGGALSNDGLVSGNHGEEDAWVIKLDPTGAIQWSKTYGGTNNERAEAIRQTPDGGYVVSGYSESTNGDISTGHGDFDYWVFKISAGGALEWSKTYGGSLSDFCFDVQVSPAGGYVVAGSTFSNNGDVGGNTGFYDYWIVRLDVDGDIVWEKNYGGNGEERAYAIALTPDGGIAIGGASISSNGQVSGNHGNFDYWVTKLDQNGDLVWASPLGGSLEDRGFSIGTTNDNGLIVSGYAVSGNGNLSGNYGSKDGWVLKLDESGQIVWEKNFGGSSDDRITSFLQTNDGGFIGAGQSSSADNDLPGNHGTQDFWVLRLTPDSLEFALGNDTTLCPGATLNLKVTESDLTYIWQDGTTLPTYSVSTTGEYWVEIDKLGCIARDTIQVDYYPGIPVDLGADTTLCEGETLLLKPGIADADYLWKDNSIDPEFLVEMPGTYWVNVEKNGCEFFDTITIGYLKVDLELGNDTILCDGQSLTLDVTTDNAQYLWSDGSTGPVFQIAGQGEYWVKVGQSGCQRTDSIQVDYQIAPDSLLEDYTYICEDQSITFNVTQPGGTYIWQDSSSERILRVVKPGKYSVTVTLNGCPFSDELELRDCENCLYVPNAFSPNNDGANDFFQTYPGCEILNFEMRIFDRWGALLFTSTAPEQGWDGLFRGDKIPGGTYVYWLRYDLLNNKELVKKEKKGSVSLLR